MHNKRLALIAASVAVLVVFLFWFLGWLFRGALQTQEDRDALEIARFILSGVTLVPIVWAVVRYRGIADDQRKAKHYQAWLMISNTEGQPGDGGRKAALEDLHADGFPLVGVRLTGGAFLPKIHLPGANLTQANFRGATLFGANLRGAVLVGANFQGANLLGADLGGADLVEAVLWHTNFQDANLKKARLVDADLTDANLARANLEGASLWGANLQKVKALLAQNVSREEILNAKDWRGAELPIHLKDIELPLNAAEQKLDELGRTWHAIEVET